MGNFIAKRWTYIDDTIVWSHHSPDPRVGPNYLNAKRAPTDARSETDFAYLSADGEPTQKFVDAGLKSH